MGKRKYEKKVLGYIEIDDVKKLKQYVRKHELELLSFKSAEKGSLLHVAASTGSERVIRYLLDVGLDATQVDEAGNTPLHCACLWALDYKKYGYSEIIAPLIKAYKAALTLQNTAGLTPVDIMTSLDQYHSRTNNGKSDVGSPVYVSSDEDEAVGGNNRAEERGDWGGGIPWQEKLAAAAEADFEDFSYQKYEPDHRDEYPHQQEEYYAWSERIGREYRQNHSTYHNHSRHKPQSEDEPKPKKPKLRPEFPNKSEAIRQLRNRKHSKLKENYIERCKLFFHAKNTSPISVGTVPWPVVTGQVEDGATIQTLLTEENINSLLFVDSSIASDEGKKLLRSQQLQWHPDRFMQRCRDRLPEKEHQLIMDMVNQVSQILNAMGAT